jgi:hypothetical protein
MVRGLVQRGYLAPNEVDEDQAVEEAMTLFVWDIIERSSAAVH